MTNTTQTRILLAEDDQRLAQLVHDFLTANDFDVAIESNGNNVIRRVMAELPQLLILDLGLPGKNGLDICKEIRPHYTGPILILTARNSDADQVLGLEYGADDYVIKPVDPRVLLARIKALLRRNNPDSANALSTVTIGSLVIQAQQRQVLIDNQAIALSSHEFELLSILAQNAGQVLSREYLFKAVYHREYDGLDRSIDVRISQLRKHIQDDSDNPTRIKTIWGRGYVFVKEAW
jgi:DNA-binding response OmpR family regulator